MSWFPNFLNWENALWATAAAVPALLVLYFLKLRRREMAVPSTLLWRKAIQDLQVNAPFQKLRRNLLLLLQLIILLLLLLAWSQPVSNYTPGPGSTTVILIDRSASMSARDIEGGHTRLEEAKRMAKDLIAGMKRNSKAMVVAFDDSAEMLQPFTEDQGLLRRAIDSIEPTDRKTDLRLAYQLAEAQVNFNPEQLRENTERPDVRLYSDGRVLNEQELRLKGQLKYDPLGSDKTGNVAIVALNAKRNYDRPTQVQVFARLANFGPDPVEAGVKLSINGEQIETETSKLEHTVLLPERWNEEQRGQWEETTGKKRSDSVEFKLDLTQAAVIRVEQTHKENDALAADDYAQVVVPPPKSLSVLLVSDFNLYLEKAIRSLNLTKPVIMRPGEYEDKYKDKPPTEFDVIIYDNYTPPTDKETGKTILPSAGSFIWFGKVPEGIKTKVNMRAASNSTTGPAAVAAGAARLPVILEGIRVLDWKRDNPMLKDLALSRLEVDRALSLNVPLDQEVLIDGLKGPLLVLDREDRQTHLIGSFDLLDSNWPLRQSFPIFLYQALQFLAIGSDMDVRQSLEPGTAVRIPRANLLRVAPDLKSLTLNGPGGSKKVMIPPTGDFVLPPMNRVGLYTTDPPIPQFEQMAVNLLDANESNLQPRDKPPGDIGETQSAGTGKSRLELWWPITCVALAVLFIEWWVYTRRVHL